MMPEMANRWTALALVFLTRTSMGFQFQSVASVAPLMIADLGLSYTQLGTLTGLYMLPGVLFAATGSLIGQRLGERRVVLGGLGLMVLGGIVTASAAGFTAAATGRVLSGIGAVLMNILLAKLVADWFTGKEMSTAMAVMLTSWPVGLGLGQVTLGALAARTSWRTALVATALIAGLGLILMLLYRDPPVATPAAPAPGFPLSAADARLAGAGGFVWGCFNASIVVIIVFGPTLLIARGATLADANGVVSLATWLTMVSVPLGGLLSDRRGRSNSFIVAGSLLAAGTMLLIPVISSALLAFSLLGLAIGVAPGAIMALLPRTLPPERVTTAFGVFYTVFYVMMVLTQPAAGFVRDRVGDPAAPIVFAAVVMAVSALGLAIFRRLQRATRPA
ncbi:MAG: MFS transporter [Candidatus Rokuibacteriota bacterium]|nr:MAG: MFS transporter [Candidatus Rokubacteria bacterium]